MKSELIPVISVGNDIYKRVSKEEAFQQSARKIKFADAKRRNKKKRKKAVKGFFAKLFGK